MIKQMARCFGRVFRKGIRHDGGAGIVETIVTVAVFTAVGLIVYSAVSNALNTRANTITNQINSISSGGYTGPSGP